MLHENVELLIETIETGQKEFVEMQEVTKFWAAQAGTFAGQLHNLEQEFEHKDKELNSAISFYRKQIVHAQEDIVILEANLAEAEANILATTWPGPY